MSLLINGMDMPKNGRVTIDLASEETGTNIIARITDDKTGKLIEHKGVVVIPTPHGGLIDADKLLHKCQKISTQAWKMKLHADVEITMNQFIDFVKQAPTIIEAEGEP